MTVLEATDVRVDARRGRAWIPVVDGIDFKVAPSEAVGIVGETGAGKTLATRALVGLLPRGTRGRGDVSLAGHQFTAGGREARASLVKDAAVVLQNPMTALDPLNRVESQLVEAVLRHRLLSQPVARERALHLLGRLGFEDPEQVMRHFPHQLSGGMAQRVAIAAALMARPSLLIVDEPTSALDASIRLEVLRTLKRVTQEEGAGMVLVSHDLSLVSHFCERVMVLYAGRVLETGTTAAVLDDPRHPYTRALLACAPRTDAPPRTALPVIEGAPPAPGHWPPACVFQPRCPLAFDRCYVDRPRLISHDGVAAACHLVEGSLLDESGPRERRRHA